MKVSNKQFLSSTGLFCKRFTFGFVLSLLVVAVMPITNLSSVQAAEDDEEGGRPPPSTRSASTLTRAVYSRIEEVVEFRDAEQYPEALEVLAEIKELYDKDRLNDYETYMMYVFYASISMETNDYPQAIEYWREILDIPELAPDNIGQALLTLGQLLQAEGDYHGAIDSYIQYLDTVESPGNDVSLRISMAYYAIEEYAEALPWVLEHIDLERADGNEIPENTFQILKSLYFSLEDYVSARQVLREMIILFDPQPDWGQLAQVEGQLDNLQAQSFTYYMAYQKGYLDREGQLMTLAFQTYGNDNPWGAAKIIQKGIEDGIIDGNDENLAFMSLCFQVAREDEKALEPLILAIEQSGDGALYYRLGQLYANLGRYEEAIEAMQEALETDDVDREDQLLLSMANSYLQINRFDEAIDAARRAGRADERSSDTAVRYTNSVSLMKERYERIQEQRQELAEWL